ncbi:MAG TPA: hypothetical protein VIV58_26755 [Kofleriaceae bacterium]
MYEYYWNADSVPLVLGTPVYVSAVGQVKRAVATSLLTASVAGIVADANIAVGAQVRVLPLGALTGSVTQWDAVTGSSTGLTPDAAYYLSTTTGLITTVAPADVGKYITYVGTAASTTDMDVAVAAVQGPIIDSSLKPLLVKKRGDSNDVGQGTIDKLDRSMGLSALNLNVLSAKTYALGVVDPPSLLTYGPAPSGPYQATTSIPGMGHELSLAAELYAIGALPYISDYGIDGTTAADHAPASLYPSTGGNLYTRVNAFHDQQVIASGRSKASVDIYTIGTNDASTAPLSAAFQANLAAYCAARRVTVPGLHIFQPTVNPNGSNTYTSVVRAAQVAYAATDPLFHLVSTDDLPLGAGDGYHHSSDEYVTIGQRLAYSIGDTLGYSRPTVSTAYPQFIGSDVGVYGTGVITPRSWAGETPGDLEILVVSTGLLAAAIALTSAQGFTLVGSVTSVFSGLDQQLAVFSRPVVAGSLVNGMMPSPVVTDNNNLNAAAIWVVRGAAGVVPVIEASQTCANNADGTNLTMTGVTTLGDNRLIMMIGAGYAGGANTVSVANAGLTSVVKQRDALYQMGSDYQIMSLTTGVKAVAGATGNATLTSTAACIHTGITLAIKTS